MLTLRELLDDLDVRVVAGEEGLDAAVRWVHISEQRDPTPWLSGGEFLLSIGIGLGDDPAGYLERVADYGLAGLGIGVGTENGVPEVPAELIQAAERRAFPLVEIPYELPFLAITEKAAAAIVTEQYAVMQRAMQRLGGDVLAAVLSRELTGEELERRLEPFGLGNRIAALVAQERGQSPFLQSALRAEGVPGIVTTSGEYACALVPAPGDDEELFALAERLRIRAQEALGEPLTLGAGRAAAPADLRRSFHEARCALEAHSNGAAVVTHRELGSAQLLLSLQDDDALALFCDAILAPIEQAEGGYGGELIRSLEAFLEANGHWEGAARALNCHRHTLRYRIRRVEELTGRSLDSAHDRIDFWLALRGRELTR